MNIFPLFLHYACGVFLDEREFRSGLMFNLLCTRCLQMEAHIPGDCLTTTASPVD